MTTVHARLKTTAFQVRTAHSSTIVKHYKKPIQS
ncbi:Putative protein [Zobellia galactanivorans]|uniref:Uncharacterized protein n=1 Tax=Zobellia galactanivorans (strain DSM 12802 / CCUG 47099 / CIP 106680 / NCIMB 13871 / Dsij) TaxID=63186 RepID=G0L7E9_ZOBGA|nr:Putative protein [Zobellia galactanivorans]